MLALLHDVGSPEPRDPFHWHETVVVLVFLSFWLFLVYRGCR